VAEAAAAIAAEIMFTVPGLPPLPPRSAAPPHPEP
jgi:hypothetical protein